MQAFLLPDYNKNVFEKTTLQSLIEARVPWQSSGTGWRVGKCPLCNDYKVRGGFKFEDDQVIYNCWNCSTASRYTEFSGKMSNKFKTILRALDIDDDDIRPIVNTALFFKKGESDKITLSKLTKVNTTTPTIKLPAKSFPLGHTEFLDYQEKLVDYLLDRKIDISKYQMFFSLEQRFINRVIIPYYRNGNLIYWQGRHTDPKEKLRYDNAPVGREAVMFNMDELTRYSDLPLFVCEGVFDAMMVDGVALLGSRLNDAKIDLLSKSNRRIVFVIDKDSNGKHLAETVIEHGWEIAFSPDGTEDLNESVRRFGLCYTTRELFKSIPKDADYAKIAINIHCGAGK